MKIPVLPIYATTTKLDNTFPDYGLKFEGMFFSSYGYWNAEQTFHIKWYLKFRVNKR